MIDKGLYYDIVNSANYHRIPIDMIFDLTEIDLKKVQRAVLEDDGELDPEEIAKMRQLLKFLETEKERSIDSTAENKWEAEAKWIKQAFNTQI